MSELSPKPTNVQPLRDWKFLDGTLQQAFTKPDPKERAAVINPLEYVMSREEIMNELRANGYSVEVIQNEIYNGQLLVK